MASVFVKRGLQCKFGALVEILAMGKHVECPACREHQIIVHHHYSIIIIIIHSCPLDFTPPTHTQTHAQHINDVTRTRTRRALCLESGVSKVLSQTNVPRTEGGGSSVTTTCYDMCTYT